MPALGIGPIMLNQDHLLTRLQTKQNISTEGNNRKITDGTTEFKTYQNYTK